MLDNVFSDRLAVVTGGGSGIGRELVVQLAAEGCSVATCARHQETLAETVARAIAVAPPGTRVDGETCDVADEVAVERFRDAVTSRYGHDHLDFLFNSAGSGGGASFVAGDRASWERTFNVCWGGVYNCCRVFMPLLIASDEAWVVNVSSVNSFWAGDVSAPNTAYTAAKFAVKGFSESLIADLRLHAPHVRVAVAMPGHVGTDILLNSIRDSDGSDGELTVDQREHLRDELRGHGHATDDLADEDARQILKARGERFRDSAPTSAEQAARAILDGVRAGTWRILVGEDARIVDDAVRADPIGAYDPDAEFLDALRSLPPMQN